MVYTNQTICWDPIETERSEAPDTPGESMITVTNGSKRPGTDLAPSLSSTIGIKRRGPKGLILFLLTTLFR